MDAKTQEAGAGTKIRIGIAEIGAIKTALRGVRWIVPRIAKPRHSKLRYECRLVEERDFFAQNLKVGNTNLAESVAIQHRRQRRDLLGQLHRTPVAVFRKRVDVARFFREHPCLKPELRLTNDISPPTP